MNSPAIIPLPPRLPADAAPAPAPGQAWMTYREAAAYLRVSERWLRGQVAAGRIRARRALCGRVVRFSRADLDGLFS